MGQSLAQTGRVLRMSLAVLKRTRRRPRTGDVFAMAPSDGKYLYGRVVSTDANPLGAGGGILIYLYRARSTEKSSVPKLLREQLLVPPIITNALPWTKGYFEFIENRPLTPMDSLRQHSFSRAWTSPKQYFDEKGNQLAGPVEPVGQWGLHSFQTIDAEISAALGLPTEQSSTPPTRFGAKTVMSLRRASARGTR